MGFITYQSVVGDPIVVETEDRWVEIVTELNRHCLLYTSDAADE